MAQPDRDVDSRSYFQPEDLTTLAAGEGSHYWHLARRKVILDALPSVDAGARLLDIGCGPGTTATYFNAHGYTVDYADVHAEALALARHLAANELGEQPVEQLRFMQLDIYRDRMPRDYAGVLLLDVIEHLPDDIAALRNVREGLEPGDHLVVTVPAFPSLWSRFDEIARHKRRYTRQSTQAAVEAAGFEVDSLTYFFAPLFIASNLVRLGRKVRDALPVRWRASGDNLDGLMETKTSPLLTKIAVWLLDLERPFVRRGRVPFGTSVLCVARAVESREPRVAR